MLKSAAGGRVGGLGRAGVNFWFPVNNLSLLWPIDAKLDVWVAYSKRQVFIDLQMSVIKVKVIVAKKEMLFPLNNLSLLLLTLNLVYR